MEQEHPGVNKRCEKNLEKVGVGSHGGGKHTHTHEFPEEVVDDGKAHGNRRMHRFGG